MGQVGAAEQLHLRGSKEVQIFRASCREGLRGPNLWGPDKALDGKSLEPTDQQLDWTNMWGGVGHRPYGRLSDRFLCHAACRRCAVRRGYKAESLEREGVELADLVAGRDAAGPSTLLSNLASTAHGTPARLCYTRKSVVADHGGGVADLRAAAIHGEGGWSAIDE
ncbi:hypothetical protein G7046_g5067 [Stylonectria norvegica]|nr:hypothetical protein G7046_g5067 [Stylonectria norvegica]